eukprot:PhM_4_TR13677/c1_g1_i1/m.19400
MAEKQFSLNMRFALGLKPDVTDSVHFIDDQTCCWPVGRNIVIYSMQTTQQRFIPATDGMESITALQLSPNRKYLAIAESGPTPCISIVDLSTLKRKKFLSIPDIGSKEYVCLAFSSDGRYMLSQGGAPEWSLVYWNIDKGKPVTQPFVASNADKVAAAQDKRHITRCTFNPRDATHFCLSGNGLLKFIRYQEGALKIVPGGMGKREPQMYLTHIWLQPEERIIVSTDNGDLLLLENYEYKAPLPLSPSDALSIDTMIVTSKGFICGSDMGIVTVFEKGDQTDLYRKVRTSKIDSGAFVSQGGGDASSAESDTMKIKSFALTLQEETLAVATTNHQVFSLNLSDFGKEDHLFEPLCQAFHSGPITGVAVCVRKPLIATCGKDRMVCIWNYNNHSREAYKVFAHEACSIAMHPSGLHILVGFTDRLRFLNLYGDDIREFKNFNVRACVDCRFSTGGQFFALANNAVIQLHLTYTCELLGNLRGHNNKVKAMYFIGPDDTQLISVGVDGSVFQWDVAELRKGPDTSVKGVSNSDVVSDGKSVWIVGSDHKLREFELHSLGQYVEHEVGESSSLTTISFSSTFRMLFSGGVDGAIKSFMLPLPTQNSSSDPSSESQMIHSGAINRGCLTYDEGIYITVGEDGAIYMFDIQAPVGRTSAARKEVEFAPEILIHRKDLDEKNNAILELQNRVKEMEVRMTEKQNERERKHEEEVKAVTEKFKAESEAQYKKYEALMSIKSSHQEQFAEAQRDMAEKHRMDLIKLRQDYQAQIRAAEDTVEAYRRDIQEQNAQFQSDCSEKDSLKENTIANLQRKYETEIEQQRDLAETLCNDEASMKTEFEKIRVQMEIDTDNEIDMLKELYDHKLNYEKGLLEDLKIENAFLKKQHQQLTTEIKDKDEDIQDKLKTKGVLEAKIAGAKKDIEALMNEITERTDTIGDKEKRIADLRKKNQELEKFRFVLEYKIRELKGQTEPKEEEIRVAGVKIAEMHQELDKYYHNNESLRLTIRDLKLKIDGQKSEITNLQDKLKYADAYKIRLREDLTMLKDSTKTVKALKEVVKKLYHKHMKGESNLSATVDEGDAQKEYHRQRDYLEKTVNGLKKKLLKDAAGHRADINRIMNENVILIKEINELRREKKLLKDTSARKDETARRYKEHSRELELQRAEMNKLRYRISDLERQLHAFGKSVSVTGPAPIQMS